MKCRFCFQFDLEKTKCVLSSGRDGVRAVWETVDQVPYISVYVYRAKVWRKRYKWKKRPGVNPLKIVNTSRVVSEVRYGFDDPRATGLLYGVLSAMDNVTQVPHFCPGRTFITVDGSAVVHLWKTLKNYANYRRKAAV